MTQTPDFDSIKQINPYGVEYWSARDLMPLLGYKKWERFEDAIKRAMTSCEQSGNIVMDHFPNVGKVIKAGKGATKEMKDALDSIKQKQQRIKAHQQSSLFGE